MFYRLIAVGGRCEPAVAALARRRRRNEDRHGGRRLEVARERAAQVSAAVAGRTRADHDDIGAFLRGYAGKSVHVIPDRYALLGVVAELERDSLERPIGGA